MERILDRKEEGGEALYLVDWKGFGTEDRTWEPVSNLRGCKRKLSEFEKQWKKKQSKKKR